MAGYGARLRERLRSRSMVCALSPDSQIDDISFIDGVERGNFRLHPAGKSGISDGCITLPSHADYAILLEALLSTPSVMVTAQLKAFGTIQVY